VHGGGGRPRPGGATSGERPAVRAARPASGSRLPIRFCHMASRVP